MNLRDMIKKAALEESKEPKKEKLLEKKRPGLEKKEKVHKFLYKKGEKRTILTRRMMAAGGVTAVSASGRTRRVRRYSIRCWVVVVALRTSRRA